MLQRRMSAPHITFFLLLRQLGNLMYLSTKLPEDFPILLCKHPFPPL